MTHLAFKIKLRQGKGRKLGFRRSKQLLFVSGSLLVGLLLLFLIIWLYPSLRLKDSRAPFSPSINHSIEDFFKAYWQRPIPSQGPPPTAFTEIEASFRPEACGTCHKQQYQDWRESLHSKAMGPGPWGQIIDLTRNSPEEAVLCMTCHAPLSEQIPVIAKITDGKKNLREES